MSQENRHKLQDMPLPARMISVMAGAFLIAIGLVLFVAVRPLRWEVVSVGVGAGGLGADLMYGGIRGTWPVAALLWLVYVDYFI